jgi:hypothetical protein
MRQSWIYRIGEATGRDVQANLRLAGVSEFDTVPFWTPFPPDQQLQGAWNILFIAVGDWRKFTRADYFGAAQALALHEGNLLQVIPWIEDGSDEPPQADAWMERYRQMWKRLEALSHGKKAIDETAARVAARRPLSVFFSYSHSDERLREQLEHHLSLLEQTGLIRGWHDRKILAGADWAAEIDYHLYTSDLILLLLSADFFASGYCSEIETPVALAREQAKSARAIPILLRPVVWRQSRLAALGALPKDARPVTEWPSTDAAFVDVCEGILHSAMAWSEAAQTPAREQRPAAPPLPRTSVRKRTLDAAMPAVVELRKSAMLVVLVRKTSSEGLRGIVAADPAYGIDQSDVKSQVVVLEFPLDPATRKPGPLSIAVTVKAPEFDPPFQTRQLIVDPVHDTAPCIFLLAAGTPGDLVVLVEASQGGKNLVSCPIRTKAVAVKTPGPMPANIQSAAFESSEDEGSVSLRADGDVFQLELPHQTSKMPGEMTQAFQKPPGAPQSAPPTPPPPPPMLPRLPDEEKTRVLRMPPMQQAPGVPPPSSPEVVLSRKVNRVPMPGAKPRAWFAWITASVVTLILVYFELSHILDWIKALFGNRAPGQ